MTISIDLLAFVVAPYLAAVLCVAGTVERYGRHGFSCTSSSSQFLENRAHFWSLVPFHYGVLVVLVLHLICIAAPAALLAWNRVPLRMYAVEITGLIAGLLAVGGLCGAIVRRIVVAPIRSTTSRFDWFVYALLVAQLAGGVTVSVTSSWGASWFAAVVTPYLSSLVRLQPDLASVAALPLLAKLHLAGAWLLIGLFPFSRLVHIVVVPHQYLWRPPQIVRWYARRSTALDARR